MQKHSTDQFIYSLWIYTLNIADMIHLKIIILICKNTLNTEFTVVYLKHNSKLLRHIYKITQKIFFQTGSFYL